MIVLFVLAVFTILLGAFALPDNSHYVISLALIAETLAVMLIGYEKKGAGAGEIVLISILCATAVASRWAMFFVPQFKPLVAVVIISGIVLGAERGFLVGAMSAFVSNFFFGQGPWTPWQMFALGMCGLLAGLFINKKIIPPKPIYVALFGALVTFLVYGGIVDTSSVFLMGGGIPVYEIYIAGAPLNLIHASASFVFLLLFTKPALKILNRVKTKYGIEKDK